MCDQRLIEKLTLKQNNFAHEVWVEYYDKVKRAIHALIHNYPEAEERAADIFVKLYNNSPDINSCQSLWAYLGRAARNSAIDYYRKRKWEWGKQQDERFHQYVEAERYSNNQSKEQGNGWLIDMLMDDVEALPPQQKEIMLLRHVEGVKPKQIAVIMNLAVQTVHNQLGIGLRNLVKKYPDLPIRKDT